MARVKLRTKCMKHLNVGSYNFFCLCLYLVNQEICKALLLLRQFGLKISHSSLVLAKKGNHLFLSLLKKQAVSEQIRIFNLREKLLQQGNEKTGVSKNTYRTNNVVRYLGLLFMVTVIVVPA